eukprot:CAMPEP_0113624806 /NCGR_PEP_ID=MMETSP0017_2-20120614/12800_1 /TAXON_ID=2856 /ORGANISM="Cylindrotheca closterium" /LENGTH=188 /DNA_ID=CAMNT_0000534873 /DNA_START=157 /DNA_END=723 /DNA_ORIENTATION=+ /assembly_acc=CAM_ASM_000147
MKKLQGDLLAFALEGTFDVIVHGCNCQGHMGAGIAKSIKTQFPEAFVADRETTTSRNRDKLGNYSTARIQRGDDNNSVNFMVVNAYTQFHWKGRGVKADYGAIQSVFQKLKQEFSGLRIGYPMIGAGLAGGDWSIISAIIDEELEGEDHTLVEFVPPPASSSQQQQKRRSTRSESDDMKKGGRKKLKK